MQADKIADQVLAHLLNGYPVDNAQLTDEGKFLFETSKPIGSPWRFFSHDPRMDCTYLHQVVFKGTQKIKGLNFVPSACQDCYKVVIPPPTYNDLKNVERFLDGYCYPGRTGKCGVEKRLTTKGLYGAYVYCRGLDEGLKRFAKIATEIKLPMYLKRGCTEMETACGPSDKWEVTDRQLDIEKALDAKIEMRLVDPSLSKKQIGDIHKHWREMAFKYDPSMEHKVAPCVRYED
jgi:hypothetical protein